MSDTSTLSPDELERQRRTQEAMAADGVSTATTVQANYFGFGGTNRTMLPDGVSWVEVKVLTEGDRRRYFRELNREVKVEKLTGNAVMQMQNGEERIILLQNAIVGWNLAIAGEPVQFSRNRLDDFLETADPKIIDIIEADVRKHNPWLDGEVTVEDMEKQVRDLKDRIEAKKREEEGKAS